MKEDSEMAPQAGTPPETPAAQETFDCENCREPCAGTWECVNCGETLCEQCATEYIDACGICYVESDE